MRDLPAGDEKIIEYLLEALPETEAEKFDELSFTDDDFSARLNAIENELVDSYVRGELDGERLSMFESRYLASPIRREKVAFARGFVDALDRAAASGASVASTESSTPFAASKQWTSRRESKPARRSLFSSKLTWAFAAALVLLIAAGAWLAIQNARLRDEVAKADADYKALRSREQELQAQLDQKLSSDGETEEELATLREKLAELETRRSEDSADPDKPNVVAFSVPPQLRGIGEGPTLSLPGGVDLVNLRLELERQDLTSYRVNLRSLSDNRTVWRSGRIRARTGSNTATFSIRAETLKPGRYVAEVFGVAANAPEESVGSYSFRVVAP
jgi:hypothetical protein